jgi:exonuclease III
MSILTENNSINTCTLNVNGLLDRQCQFSLKEFLLQNKVDILFLYEIKIAVPLLKGVPKFQKHLKQSK